MVQSNLQEVSPEEPESEQESLIDRFRQWVRENITGKEAESFSEAIKEVLQEHEEEVHELPEEEQQILKKVLTFGVLTVSDIMTPRTDIKAVEYTTSLEQLKANLGQNFHTRLPVFNDTLDNIKGFIHTKDLIPAFAGDSEFNMAFVLREVLFVPPSMKLTDLLLKMRKAGVHIAIVIDEYGGTDGLVTLEDVFEEIVGEIQDEHDEDELEETLQWNVQGSCDLNARVRIDKIEKDLEISLKVEDENADFDTLGGFVFYTLKRVPIPGETITQADGTRLEVISADARMIKKVRIYKSTLGGKDDPS